MLPQPLVGLQAIEKVLNRHTVVACPESCLVVAVLARAIHDSLSLSNRRMRREARRRNQNHSKGIFRGSGLARDSTFAVANIFSRRSQTFAGRARARQLGGRTGCAP